MQRSEQDSLFNDFTEDSWFKAKDFTEEGRTFTIDRIETREIAPKVEKLVVFFKGENKGFVLNVVNKSVIAKNTGQADVDNWKGYKITLYSTKIKVKDVLCSCIRIKILIGSFAEKDEISLAKNL